MSSGPSEQAVMAAVTFNREPARSFTDHRIESLAAAHDRTLGLDRSVCLREAFEYVAQRGNPRLAADLAHHFGVGKPGSKD